MDAVPDSIATASPVASSQSRRPDETRPGLQHEPEAELLLGVKFSTHGSKTDAAAARRLAANDYLGVQISLDGVTADVNDAVRGRGSYTTAVGATGHLADAGMTGRRRARCRTGRVGVAEWPRRSPWPGPARGLVARQRARHRAGWHRVGRWARSPLACSVVPPW